MSFGYQRLPRKYIGDTATIKSYIYNERDEQPVPESAIQGVVFTVQAPYDDPTAPSILQQPGVVTADGEGTFIVPTNINSASGSYYVSAQFTFTDEDGNLTVTSVPSDYDVIDPFEKKFGATSDPAVDLCWLKLEDIFDSELGGPWLRDMTLNRFDKSKVAAFLPDVMFFINLWAPQTTYTSTTFDYDEVGTALVGQGLLVSSIKHLMRSYVEQPDVMNSSVGFMDRKAYLDRWKLLFDVEDAAWKAMVDQYKRLEFNKVGSALLVSQKAGRMLPGSYRTRGVVRGF